MTKYEPPEVYSSRLTASPIAQTPLDERRDNSPHRSTRAGSRRTVQPADKRSHCRCTADLQGYTRGIAGATLEPAGANSAADLAFPSGPGTAQGFLVISLNWSFAPPVGLEPTTPRVALSHVGRGWWRLNLRRSKAFRHGRYWQWLAVDGGFLVVTWSSVTLGSEWPTANGDASRACDGSGFASVGLTTAWQERVEECSQVGCRREGDLRRVTDSRRQ